MSPVVMENTNSIRLCLNSSMIGFILHCSTNPLFWIHVNVCFALLVRQINDFSIYDFKSGFLSNEIFINDVICVSSRSPSIKNRAKKSDFFFIPQRFLTYTVFFIRS